VLGKTRRIHFVGIGGIGMSGIAELLANLGYAVSGSDAKRSETTARLAGMGVTVFEGHAAEHVGGADVLVYSSAVKPSNPEVVEARRRGVPVIPRAEMLAQLMRLRFSVAVAGSHGKTTTTSMIAWVLERAGLDPTAVIGGRLSAFGSNARLGGGEVMVAEADESDRSFLTLSPSIAVVTNIDREHMESYGSFTDLQQAFVDFANKVPFYGSVVACVEDPHVAEILPRVTRRVLTYGLIDRVPDAPDRVPAATPAEASTEPRESGILEASGRGSRAPMVFGCDVALGAFGGRCQVYRRGASDRGSDAVHLGQLELSVPGRHNLQNALAAVAVGDCLDVDFPRVASALKEFHGAERRFERVGEAGGILIVDDYGHHPTEVAAVLAAARATLGRRLLVAFQPHRYSRTARLMDEFGRAFAEADEVVLTEIYAASEDPVPGVTAEALAAVVRRHSGRPVHVAPTLDAMVEALVARARPGDAVLTLGAGSIGSVPRRLLRALEDKEARG
jgi:UDP-N-acetylmuramate--alanine ligase